uniref:non-specific serine/threonine protein kinase n=1 Tax=Castor canadensis TaxID=51338 RepID=A0A8B7TNZ9_CASCN|nr:sperm motility kinase Z-like [Castor canadensis]
MCSESCRGLGQHGLEASFSNEEHLRTQYLVLRRLGRGGFGQVRLAYHRLTGMEVAVKVVKKGERNFLSGSEVDLMRALDHPQVIRLFQVIEGQQHIFLVMEHAAGGPLWRSILHLGRLREAEARRLFWQMACAVRYCHARGIAHRDLKPNNILLDEAGNVKLADFGLATWFTPGQKLQLLCGALSFRAPEVYLGQTYDGPKVDVWSLGVMLYLMVTGQLPFKGITLRELKPQVLKGRFTIPYHLSAVGRSLIYCLLTQDPVQRPTMEGVLLHPWLSATEERPPTHSSPTLPNRLDPTIMLVMIDMGFDPPQVRDSLLRRRCDEASCTYLMLQRQKHQGLGYTSPLQPVLHRPMSCQLPAIPSSSPPTQKSASAPALSPITSLSPVDHSEDDSQPWQGSSQRSTMSATPLLMLRKSTPTLLKVPQSDTMAAPSAAPFSSSSWSSSGSSMENLRMTFKGNNPSVGQLHGVNKPSACDTERLPENLGLAYKRNNPLVGQHHGVYTPSACYTERPSGGIPHSTGQGHRHWEAVSRRIANCLQRMCCCLPTPKTLPWNRVVPGR